MSAVGNIVSSVANAVVAPIVAPVKAIASIATGGNVGTAVAGATEATLGSGTAAINNATGGALGKIPVIGAAIQTQSNIVDNPTNPQYVANAALTDVGAAAAGVAGGLAAGALSGGISTAGITTAGVTSAIGVAKGAEGLLNNGSHPTSGAAGTVPVVASAALSTQDQVLLGVAVLLGVVLYLVHKKK